MALATRAKHIAAWGDSLTPPFAANLQLSYPGRGVYNGGVSDETSTQIATRATADTSHATWINVFWYGQNIPLSPSRSRPTSPMST